MTGSMMLAMVIEEFGGPDVFKVAKIPIPEMKAGHVLIRVHATSVNPIEGLIRTMGPPFAPALPAVLHGDVAGTVEAVAPDVTTLKIGDEVYACAGGVIGTGGALAEYMLADASFVAPKPKSLSMRQAAALPLVTITAWEGVFQRARVKPGSTVLIHGGAGGVGHIAVQLAKIAGAKVHATVSSEDKATIVHSFGADAIIHYKTEDVKSYVDRLTDGKGFDVVFDTVSGSNLANSFEAARFNGDVLATVSLGQFDLTPVHLRGLSLHVIFMLIPLIHNVNRAAHGAILREAAQLIDAGQIRPLLDPHTFRIRDVAEAHRLLESGEAVGKVVLEAAP